MKILETIFGEQASSVLMSQTFAGILGIAMALAVYAGIAAVFTALSALSFVFGETPLQISLFFTLALVSMGFACAGFPYRAAGAMQTVSDVDNDEDLEALARNVGVLTLSR